jgi:tRNA pseudouridine38-40 synthase
MPRYKLTLEYDGGPFAGWQLQANALTVQGVLEEAVFRINGEAAVSMERGARMPAYMRWARSPMST